MTTKISILKTGARLLILTALLFTAFTANASDKEATPKDKEGAQIVFSEKNYNFGFIPEAGGPVTHFFEFTNTGDAPLVIISATASCGCTRPTYPTEPIAAGKKGKIKVTYLPEGRPGEFDKTIKVRTNAKDAKKISLKITGTVVNK